MNGIEPFRLRFRNPQHLHAQNAETGMLNHTENVPGRILRDRVRFDDAECTLQRLHYSYESLFSEFLLVKTERIYPSVQPEGAQSAVADVSPVLLGLRCSRRLPDRLGDGLADDGRRLRHLNSCSLQRLNLLAGRAMSSGDD